MQTIVNQIAKELNISTKQVNDTIKLIDDGNTIPFIARYRKEATGGLSDEVLRDFSDRLSYLRNLNERKEDVLRLIEEQGKLTEELKEAIESAEVLQRVEDLYRPYKQKRRTKGAKAEAKGLGPLAETIVAQDYTGDLAALGEQYLTEDVTTIEEAFDGAMDIIREKVSDNPDYRKHFRNEFYNNGVLAIAQKNEDENGIYEMYYDYKEKVSTIVNHRVLAIDRGETEDVLSIKLSVDDEKYIEYIKDDMINNKNTTTNQYLEEGIERGYKELLAPAVERDIRRKLTDKAQEDAIKIFAQNTKDLLMQPPIKDAKVLAIDPSFRTGCKVCAIDEVGNLLDYCTIYPNEPRNETTKSRKKIIEMIEKYDIDVIPIGNGTASRETEQFIADTLKVIDKEVYYTIVSEAGASVYSASKIAQQEYPEVNVSIRGAISIGKRLQDPLAELVKIDPQSIGVGQYQHDLNQSDLSKALTEVVEDSVNKVGVEINSASISLLEYVSGISSATAENILNFKKEHGKFSNRKQLKDVSRLGPKTFEQCAGFLRIKDGENVLDNTAVHPENYEDTLKFLAILGYSLEDIKNHALDKIDDVILEKGGYSKIADTIDIGIPTLTDIVKELKKPGRDPREENVKPIFRNDVLTYEDLEEGMVLQGTVRNVVDFGAFVDIGIKNDGLVHISELSNSYVKHPMDIVSVGDVVDVKIIDIDLKRKRISLSMKNV